ncbi:hypothetical protein [Paenibacillus sp. NPDC057934]|uniref:hypothetical protein n=1 Tax=Paenibacillus sp. NPDC057934 TaxID=3346282 RepID=UPI0036DAAF82
MSVEKRGGWYVPFFGFIMFVALGVDNSIFLMPLTVRTHQTGRKRLWKPTGTSAVRR